MYSEDKRYLAHASFTVEAAFVVPLVIVIIFSMLQMAYYYKDLMVADAYSAYLAEQGYMAQNFRKIPYERLITLKKWKESELEDYINDHTNSTPISEGVMLSSTSTMKGEVYIDGGTVESNVRMTGLKKKELINYRERQNFQMYTRLTQCLYRIAKEIM